MTVPLAKTLQDIARRKRYLTVAHCADVHYPDHSQKALELAYKVYAVTQPDVIVVGSDEADLSVLSSFAPDPDAVEQTIDVLDAFRAFHHSHVERIHAAAPNAQIVFIMGNHERRIYHFLAQHAPKLRRTVERVWIETVQAGGRVHWLGNVSELLVHTLLVKHGDRTNEGVAKSMLIDTGFQVSIMAGHVHRTSAYSFTGYHRTVTAITSGCLCNLIPSYLAVKGVKPLRSWQNGTALATVDTKDGAVWIENLLFLPHKNGLKTLLRGDVVTV